MTFVRTISYIFTVCYITNWEILPKSLVLVVKHMQSTVNYLENQDFIVFWFYLLSFFFIIHFDCENGTQKSADARCCHNAAWDANNTWNIAVGCPRIILKIRIRTSSYMHSDIPKASWTRAIYWRYNVSKSIAVSSQMILHSCPYSIYGQQHHASVSI